MDIGLDNFGTQGFSLVDGMLVRVARPMAEVEITPKAVAHEADVVNLLATIALEQMTLESL